MRQPGEVTDHLRLAESGQSDLCLPIETAEARFEGRRIGEIDAATAGRILHENQSFFDLQAAVAGNCLERRRLLGGASAYGSAPAAHDKASQSSRSSRSMSSPVTISVIASNRISASSGRFG